MLTFKEDTHQYFSDNREAISVTSALEAEGFSDYSMVTTAVLEAAKKFGKVVHRTCQLCDLGTLDYSSVDKPIKPYLAGWKHFKKDYGVDYIPEMIEKPIYSKLLNIAGTPDRLPIVIRKRSTLIEIKSTSVVMPTSGLQLAGYKIILKENGMPVQVRWVVHLTPEGYRIVKFDDPMDETTFYSIMNVYRWKQKHLKGGKYGISS